MLKLSIQIFAIITLFHTVAFSAVPLTQVKSALWRDVLKKLDQGGSLQPICTDLEIASEALLKLALKEGFLERTASHVLSAIQESCYGTPIREDVARIMAWLTEKYGMLDEPILIPFDIKRHGSYDLPSDPQWKPVTARLADTFELDSPISLSDLAPYLNRKWGGLANLFPPEQVIFSELGTLETIKALKLRLFSQFVLVNGPYANRGSKILIGIGNKDEEVLCFHSFVSPDLLHHKMMQLKLFFGTIPFGRTTLLSSNGPKSWEVAERRVYMALKQLPLLKIDDLVFGYDREVEEAIKENGKPVGDYRLGDFASLRLYDVRGKTGWARRVAILRDVSLRYFGNGVIPFIAPFLKLGIHRVVFAGSAGSLDRAVPPLGILVPRSFYELQSNGSLSPPLPIDNDLFGLLPFGHIYSGRHLSIDSPLRETLALIDRLRQGGFQSVDVEVARIARLIAEHNAKIENKVGFACALLATDFPLGSGDEPAAVGLSSPNFAAKKTAKERYAQYLRFLWDLPIVKITPSTHTRLVTEFFSGEADSAIERGDVLSVGLLRTEIGLRLEQIALSQDQDLRVSLGLIKSYRDLLRRVDQAGAMPLSLNRTLPVPNLPRLPKPIARAVILQSLTRSATLNTGEVRYRTVGSSTQVRGEALKNAIAAVDFIMERANRALEPNEILELHRILQTGILAPEHLGVIAPFRYVAENGVVTTSLEAFQDIAVGIRSKAPTPAVALDHFLELEHLHGFKDGTGRVAELVAQHTALRASGHPILFPHRFDIDFILSLRRNGSYSPWLDAYVAKLYQDSLALSTWLQTVVPWNEVDSVGLTESGDVGLTLWTKRLVVLHPFFSSPSGIRLEREERDWLSRAERLPRRHRDASFISELKIDRKQYQLRMAAFDTCARKIVEN